MGFLSTQSIIPPGTVLPYAGATAPDGWLLCSSTAVSRTAYAALFAVIGTTYGTGDGSTTFNIPNTQGLFLRGAGSQVIGAVTYSSTRGSLQADQMQGHRHNPLTGTAFWTAINTTILAGGSTAGKGDATTTGDPTTNGTNGTPRTGTETRPANVSVNYIIKI